MFTTRIEHNGVASAAEEIGRDTSMTRRSHALRVGGRTVTPPGPCVGGRRASKTAPAISPGKRRGNGTSTVVTHGAHAGAGCGAGNVGGAQQRYRRYRWIASCARTVYTNSETHAVCGWLVDLECADCGGGQGLRVACGGVCGGNRAGPAICEAGLGRAAGGVKLVAISKTGHKHLFGN
ncbi:hypothetical protein HYPSUDRAFT_219524 [Hypholoma sublateritium FD-334 SS-4]|uniref:Uncharacterized protein n=1 Tax=Hypholoma sublateritium (strain FD-334 SS-4) TaxID=945553 RepID=A0A0D2P7C0_HYPSF|nr:hypothetical protein HYPSUDRAFT_219524 [Hypholoma sublateritium FD-334 SS-4]